MFKHFCNDDKTLSIIKLLTLNFIIEMAPLGICINLVYALLLIAPGMVSSKRVLMVTSQFTSHVMIMQEVTSRLAERGNSISLLWAGDFQSLPLTRLTNYTLINVTMK